MSFRRCLSGGGDIFSKSAERQGGANRTFATGGCCHGWQLEPCPYGLEPLYHFSLGNSHLETRHQGMMFRLLWTFVDLKLPSAMSHAIHKIVSIKRCQSYFISRRSPHLGISKDSELCASAHRCLHYAYARLIARVTFYLPKLPRPIFVLL